MYKLGKRQAVVDTRIPTVSAHFTILPRPPMQSNWGAAVGSWGMLKNDLVGDCVIAAIGHAVQQFTTYAGNPLEMSDAEALTTYSDITGFDPTKPETDNGTVVLGRHGALNHWFNNGISVGGKLNKPKAFLTLRTTKPSEWRSAISIFGGILVGLQFPENLFSQKEIPFFWSDHSGVSAGGHEVWINSYLYATDTYVYDLVSWGRTYRVTEEFLLKTADEMVVVYDPASLTARGVDAAGLDEATLLNNMQALS